MRSRKALQCAVTLTVAMLACTSRVALAVEQTCAEIAALLPGGFTDVQNALTTVVPGTNNPEDNGGLATAQWASVVDRDGVVCAVFFSGADRQSQWPASRVISMQKAYTANSLSLDDLALSTANLWAATQPGGSLFGLQFSNPVDTQKAYAGPAADFGQGVADPAVGQRVGGINVFGGGVGLYNAAGQVIGGLGTSGNTSCADHIISWKIRDQLGLDNVPGGVADGGTTDNIIFDVLDNAGILNQGGNTVFSQPNLTQTVSESGFGHPECGFGERPIAENLPATHPIGE